ncbi:hypothetical protein GINT2_000029 [Glugoides intestinalis]
MEEQSKKDVIMYTLQSFIGKSIDVIEINEHQHEAIQRLMGLQEKYFEKLCNDLVNEIHRRSGIKYKQDTQIQYKMTRLSDKRFNDLVIETLTVFYYRNPEYKSEKMPNFIKSMKGLILQMKNTVGKTSFIKKIDELEFYNKLYAFLDYVKHFGINEELSSKIKIALDEKVKNESMNFLEVLSFPKVFLEKVRQTSAFKDSKEHALLDDYKNKILYSLSDRSIDILKRSALIKDHISKMMVVLIKQLVIPAKKLEYFDQELKDLIEILELIKADLEGNQIIDFQETVRKFSSIIEKILEKKTETDSELASEANILKISLEFVGEEMPRIEAFQTIFDIAKDVRKLIGKSNM